MVASASDADLAHEMMSNQMTLCTLFAVVRKRNMPTSIDVDAFMANRRRSASMALSPRQRLLRGIKTMLFVSDIIAMLTALDRKRVEAGLAALNQICNCSPRMITILYNNDIEPPLIALLALDGVKHRKITVSTLKLLCMLAAQGRSLIDQPGLVEHLQVNIRSEDTLTRLYCSRLLCSFFSNPVEEWKAVQNPACVNMLLGLIQSDNETTLQLLFSTLNGLTYHATHAKVLCAAEPRIITLIVERVMASSEGLKSSALEAVRNLAANAHVFGSIMSAASRAARSDTPSHIASLYEHAHVSGLGDDKSFVPGAISVYTNMDKAEHLHLKELTMEVLWYLGTVKARGPKPAEGKGRHGLECHPVSSRNIFKQNLTARGSVARFSISEDL